MVTMNQVVELIHLAPPGQLKEVFDDLSIIVDDKEHFPDLLKDELQRFNRQQFAVVQHEPFQDVPVHTSIISEGSEDREHRYVDYETERSFILDDTTLNPVEYAPYNIAEGSRSLRKELEKSLKAYVKDSYPTGHCQVSVSAINPQALVLEAKDSLDQVRTNSEGLDEGLNKEGIEQTIPPPVQTAAPQGQVGSFFTLEIVAELNNKANFWTGKWQSEWKVDPTIRSVTGRMNVDVHYFEQTNVRLQSRHSIQFEFPLRLKDDRSIASYIVTRVANIEQNYHQQLFKTICTLDQDSLKRLRRVLPASGSKIDWDQVQSDIYNDTTLEKNVSQIDISPAYVYEPIMTQKIHVQ
ncbi:hypothetical protein TREMEDRAFT_61777 [Tremella mesenterica DSM 1558]|uniref:uncharacterized protein n=1 Tax=Tremella mesenterica (strain ATCC 24925 / CBS 8224 / DSM 1558 / NBRC 9311 / NRRL Y-6157 / RJB 2259-6 / UBC 559-6) TaxID=578456 RepID=UPI0003F4A250|nr:uncharacterized protein TREMEDRAFT_61777 [Tremella mesenterica DSM 1558]EIW70011.1 hypothetical protein TREMEDRAFT_61777 [Tremella mesenterica DSM 1558]